MEETKRPNHSPQVIAHTIAKTNRVTQLEDMPYDCLCLIISWLPIRDAVRACILSRRWRYIWRDVPLRKLIFDAPSILSPAVLERDSLLRTQILERLCSDMIFERREAFVKSAEEVFRKYILQNNGYKGLDTFRVEFLIDNRHKDLIDTWVEFAAASSPKEIALILDEPWISKVGGNKYNFPCDLFVGGKVSRLESLSLNIFSLKGSLVTSDFTSLKAIDFFKVDDDDGNIKSILSNCPMIESFSLEKCPFFGSLEISNSLPCLKILKIRCCYFLKIIQISAPNLTTFIYKGNWIPFLVQIPSSTGGCVHITRCQMAGDICTLRKLSKDLCFLKTLIYRIYWHEKIWKRNRNAKFDHLKHLVIVVRLGEMPNGELLNVASLMHVAPNLEKFKVEMQLPYYDLHPKDQDQPRKIREPFNYHHKHVKEIEITGFRGTISQIELARSLLHNASVLELMTIVHSEHDFFTYRKRSRDKCMRHSRMSTYKYLSRKVCSSAKLVVL